MKIGQYDESDGKFNFRYIVHRVMKKTGDVSVLTSYQGSDFAGQRYFRYPLDLLEQQTKNCRHLPFNK